MGGSKSKNKHKEMIIYYFFWTITNTKKENIFATESKLLVGK